MYLPDNVYNVIKSIVQYILPAVASLYGAFAQIWGLPYGEQVVGTIVALMTLLSVVLGLSTAKYNETVEKSEPKTTTYMRVGTMPRQTGVFITMTNETYDFLVWIARYMLPGFGTFFFVVAQLWNIPYATQIVASIAAVTTALGIVLGISNYQYKTELKNEQLLFDKFNKIE